MFGLNHHFWRNQGFNAEEDTFLRIRINSYYLHPGGKMENKGGVTFKHCTMFFPPVLSHPCPVPPFQSKRPGSSKQMFCSVADWSVMSVPLRIFTSLQFLLSAVNLPYCDLRWVYVPSSRTIRAPVCVNACAHVWHSMTTDKVVHLLTCCLLSWW